MVKLPKFGTNFGPSILVSLVAIFGSIIVGLYPTVSWDTIFQSAISISAAGVAAFFVGLQIKTSSAIATTNASQDLRLKVYGEIVDDINISVDAASKCITTIRMLKYQLGNIGSAGDTLSEYAVDKTALRATKLEEENQLLLGFLQKTNRTLNTWNEIAYDFSAEINLLRSDLRLSIDGRHLLESSLAWFLVYQKKEVFSGLPETANATLCIQHCELFDKLLSGIIENLSWMRESTKSKFRNGADQWFVAPIKK